VANRAERVRAYARRFHESIAAGLDVGDCVAALADACKRAIEDQTPPNTKERKRKLAYYVRCVEVLDDAAAKIKEAS
jgi:hypothetical protein